MKTLSYNGTKIEFDDFYAENLFGDIYEMSLTKGDDIVATLTVDDKMVSKIQEMFK